VQIDESQALRQLHSQAITRFDSQRNQIVARPLDRLGQSAIGDRTRALEFDGDFFRLLAAMLRQGVKEHIHSPQKHGSSSQRVIEIQLFCEL